MARRLPREGTRNHCPARRSRNRRLARTSDGADRLTSLVSVHRLRRLSHELRTFPSMHQSYSLGMLFRAFCERVGDHDCKHHGPSTVPKSRFLDYADRFTIRSARNDRSIGIQTGHNREGHEFHSWRVGPHPPLDLNVPGMQDRQIGDLFEVVLLVERQDVGDAIVFHDETVNHIPNTGVVPENA